MKAHVRTASGSASVNRNRRASRPRDACELIIGSATTQVAHQHPYGCPPGLYDARKVDDFAQRFHRPRASEGLVRHLSLYIESDLHKHVEKAAIAVGMHIAPWLRSMVRQITIDDFPASWHADQSEERSHDSRVYGKRFMLRLDEPSEAKLQRLVKQFGASKAEIIRQLLTQANDEVFPKSWQMKAAERRAHPSEQDDTHRGHRE
jgi:hypothetical protein